MASYTPIQSSLKSLAKEIIKTYANGDSFSYNNIDFVYNIKILWSNSNYVAQDKKNKDKEEGKKESTTDVNKIGPSGAKELGENKVKLEFSVSLDKAMLEMADIFFKPKNEESEASDFAIMPYVVKRNAFLENVGYGTAAHTSGELAIEYFTFPAYIGLSIVFHELAHYANCHAIEVPNKYVGTFLRSYREILNNEFNPLRAGLNDGQRVAIDTGVRRFRYLKGLTLFGMYGRNNLVRAFAEYEAEITAYTFSFIMTQLFIKAYNTLLNSDEPLFDFNTFIDIREAIKSIKNELPPLDGEKEKYKVFINKFTEYVHNGVPIKLIILESLRARHLEKIRNVFVTSLEGVVRNIIPNLMDYNNIGINRVFNILLGEDKQAKKANIMDLFSYLMAEMFLREFVFFFFLSIIEGFDAVKTAKPDSKTKSVGIGKKDGRELSFSKIVVDFLYYCLETKGEKDDITDEKRNKALGRIFTMSSMISFVQAAYAVLQNHVQYIGNWDEAASQDVENIAQSYINFVKYARAIRQGEIGEETNKNIELHHIQKIIELAVKYKKILDNYKKIKEKKKKLIESIKNEKTTSKEERNNMLEMLNQEVELYNQEVRSFLVLNFNLYNKLLDEGFLMQPVVFAIYKNIFKEDSLSKKDYNDDVYLEMLYKIGEKYEGGRSISFLQDDLMEITVEAFSYYKDELHRVDKQIERYAAFSGIVIPDVVSAYIKGYSHFDDIIKSRQAAINNGSYNPFSDYNAFLNMMMLTGFGISDSYSRIYNKILEGESGMDNVRSLRDLLASDGKNAAFFSPFLVKKIIKRAKNTCAEINSYFIDTAWGNMESKARIFDLFYVDERCRFEFHKDNTFDIAKGKFGNAFLEALSNKMKTLKDNIFALLQGDNEANSNAQASLWNTAAFSVLTHMSISDSNYLSLQLGANLNIAESVNRVLPSAGKIEFLTGLMVDQRMELSIKEMIIKIFNSLFMIISKMSRKKYKDPELQPHYNRLKSELLIILNAPSEELPLDIFIAEASSKIQEAGERMLEFINGPAAEKIDAVGKQKVAKLLGEIQKRLQAVEKMVTGE
ncbi:MAG: hypothetical protein KatS3mg101_1131 [Patescibacteria group bacterium]|nr:MAG: hypothetical protein KatS3mg101_1131 [Patescibacteria group bacterium]